MSVLQNRYELIKALIAQITGESPDDPSFEATLRACTADIEHHSFLDTRPDAVDDAFRSLHERLADHAQFDKSRALELLAAHLLATPLESSQLNPAHCLLSLLHCTARRVLDTRLQPSPLLQSLTEQAARQAQASGSPAHSRGGSDDIPWSTDSWEDEDDYSPFSSGEDLSEWSGDELTSPPLGSPQRRHRHIGEPGEMTPRLAHTAGPGGDGLLDAEDPRTPPAVRHRRLRSPRRLPRRPSPGKHRRRAAAYTPFSLSVWLASRQTGGKPAQALDPRLCFTDAELVQQALNVLKGIDLPGPAFLFDAAPDAYRVRAGVHLPSITAPSATSLLQRVAQLGTQLRRLQRFSDGLIHTSAGLCGVDVRLRSLPTVAAFASALADQVQAIRGQLVCFELDARSGQLSLLTLRLRISVLEQQTAALHAVVHTCGWRGHPAATAAALLGRIQEQLQRHLLVATSQGGVVAGMLLAMFVAACKPCLDALHGWMERGVVDDEPAEFFVQATGASTDADSPELWDGAFALRQLSDGSLACPPFLAHLAPAVLSAGKCALMLTQHRTQVLCPHEGAASARPWHVEYSLLETESSLHEAFVTRLTALLRQHQQDTQGLDAPRQASPLKLQPPNTSQDAAELGSASGQLSDSLTGRTAGACLQEWRGATSRSSHNSLSMLVAEDLPELPPLACDLLHLPASAACTEATALGSSGSGSGSGPGDHPVGEAMRQAAAKRVRQAVAGGRNQLQEDLMLSHSAASAPVLFNPKAAVPLQPAPPAASPRFEPGSAWGELYQRLASQLDTSAGQAQPQPARLPNGIPSQDFTFPGMAATRFASATLALTSHAPAAMDPALCNNAPPLDVLLEHSLLAPLRAAAERTELQLCSAVLASGLVPQLQALRRLHCPAAPQLESFVQALLVRISTSRGVDAASQFDLDAALQDALAAAPGSFPGIAAARVELLSPAPSQQRIAGSGSSGGLPAPAAHLSVQQLSRVRLHVQLAWPLGFLADQALLGQQAALLELLLQVRWVQQSLQAGHVAAWLRRGGPTRVRKVPDRHGNAVRREMMLLVAAVQQHIITQAAAAGRSLDAAVAGSAALHDMQHAKQRYVAEVERGCLVGEEGLPRVVRGSLIQVLDSMLQYCALQRQATRATAAAEEQAAGNDPDTPTAAAGAGGGGEGAAQRLQQVQAALAAVRREFASRRRLFVKVLVSAGREGGGVDSEELGALLAAVDPNGFYERMDAE